MHSEFLHRTVITILAESKICTISASSFLHTVVKVKDNYMYVEDKLLEKLQNFFTMQLFYEQ